MAVYNDIHIDWNFLDSNSTAYFVFGDNLQKRGKGGAARLRDHPRAIGFITKKFPDNKDGSFYLPKEYSPVFFEELAKLEKAIATHPDKTFYISKLGAGLANRYKIWEVLIHSNIISKLQKFPNVVFCWKQ